MSDETTKVTEEKETVKVTEESQTKEAPAPEAPAENATPGEDAAPKEAASAKPAKKSVKKTGPKSPQAKVPKTWAERDEQDRKLQKEAEAKRKAASKGKAEPKERDPDVLLGHKATALATRGTVSKEGVLTVGEQKFGAACNSTQVKAVREAVKGKNILQFLGGVSEKALKAYAQGDIKATELPPECKAALKDLNGKFPPKMKMWPRKDAAILFVLNAERKAASRKPAANKEPVAA